MDRQAIIPRSELERILFDESVEPKALPLSLLEHITSSFSEDKEIGYGGFATVYKGMLDNGTVAVKKLFETVDIDEKKFSEEVRCLMKVKHRNIVRFIGYCSDTQGQMVDCEGKLVLADVRQRLLCFEYLPKGSLDKQITDASCGLEWRKRYQIIHGICDGLYYLHQNHIVHLDLKPANILLDDNMMPKIADFGLSRCFDEKQSRAITSNMFGTLGYMAPEFYTRRQITFKLDIYSLGMIIIEILTGEKGYADIDNVLESWRSRLEKSQIDTQLVQVRVCTEIAIECTEFNPAKRPDTQDIIDRLGATQNADEFAAETGASSGSSVEKLAVVPPGPTIGHENTMANVLKKSAEELYNMTNRNQRFSSMLENSSNVQQLTDMQETASDVEEILMIGRTEQKQKILATLSGTITQDVTVLPIYGIGGIGKTTVARLVFNDSQFVGYSRVWVYVSQKLDLDKIGNSIISQLSGESHIAEKQMIHDNLRKLLAGKKILIVLDDVWEKNPDALKALKAMLRLGVGSMVKIIVTTRDEAIAWKICHTVEPYKLEITDKICWKIIKQKTAFKNRVNKKQLKHIGKEIATKCGGVVLAAQSIGYTLNGKTSDEWESMRDNYIWNISTSEDPSSRDHEVHASLLLSYRHMPECLKLCFSYCAVFPKGHNIAKYDLIHQWIALGFTESSTLFDPMQLSEKYVTQLLEMSFLQYSKTRSSDGQHDKDVTYFTMHDLVHDLAREILADQVNKGSDAGNRCCYALLTDCSKPFQLSVSFPANIKALRFLDCGKLKLRGDAFPLAKCLHVLDLSECFILKLPGSISRLKQLRFLHAPRIKDRVVPNCITELSELNYLNLRDSRNISALPDSIGGMKGLMHLDLSGCKGIRELPTSFAELKQLVHLNLTNCRMSISEAFGGFTRLQYLNLSEILPISAKHTRGLPEIIGNLITLRYLNLSRCMKVMAPSPSEDQIHSLVCAISTLPNLEHLNLSHNAELSTIPESISNLKKLHTLDLSGCYHLKKIPDCIVKMVNLKVLTSMWGRSDKFALSQSTFAWLPNFVVHTSSDKFSSNIGLLQHTNPDELTIDRLENVTSAEEAQSIKLIEKPKIKVLKFQWNVTARRFVHDKEVLEKLVPPSSVQVLHIAGYRSVSIPDWLMGIRQYLPNLGKIYLCDFPKCSMLPPLGQLPNLWSLIICRMEGLEEWDTACTDGEEGTDELMFPKLVALSIRQCAKLKLNENSWELTRLQTLSLSRCGSMTSLPQWLGGLASLKKLKIEHCEGIRSLPDSIQELTKLEYLIIHGCPTLVKWCELTENKMKLALIKQKFLTNAQEEEMQTSL